MARTSRGQRIANNLAEDQKAIAGVIRVLEMIAENLPEKMPVTADNLRAQVRTLQMVDSNIGVEVKADLEMMDVDVSEFNKTLKR